MSNLLCIGANHNGIDVSSTFIVEGKVWIDWDDAHDLQKILQRAHTGTMIAIKSWQPTVGLRIKAIGIIKDDSWTEIVPDFGKFGRKVRWLHTEMHNFERIHDRMENMRNGSLYYEPNERLIADIIGLIR